MIDWRFGRYRTFWFADIGVTTGIAQGAGIRPSRLPSGHYPGTREERFGRSSGRDARRVLGSGGCPTAVTGQDVETARSSCQGRRASTGNQAPATRTCRMSRKTRQGKGSRSGLAIRRSPGRDARRPQDRRQERHIASSTERRITQAAIARSLGDWTSAGSRCDAVNRRNDSP